MKAKVESPNKYLIVTIENPPRYELQGEDFLRSKIIKRGPIYHNWIKDGSSVIIGIKISSWMISTLRLPAKERALIKAWGISDLDLSVFFGGHKKK